MTKKCTLCKEEKSVDLFSKGSRCKKCRALEEKERRRRMGANVSDLSYEEKVKLREDLAADNKKMCYSCNSVKSQSDFSRNKNTWDKLSSLCKPCAVKSSRRWVNDNIEKVSVYRKNYWKDNKDILIKKRNQNPDKQKELHRNWYEKNKAYKLAKNKQWVENNPEFIAKKRALRRGATKYDGNIDLLALQLRDRLCYLCGEDNDFTLAWPDQLYPTLDHKIPLSKGGQHSMENVAYVHNICNMRKGNKDLTELDLPKGGDAQ